MSVPVGLYALLGSIEGITDLFGTGDSLRVYPAMIPQGIDLPAVRYTRISGPFERSLTGPVVAADCTYQIDVVDDTYADAETAAHAIRVGIDGYSGAPTAGEFWHNVIVENMTAPFEMPPDASERWRWIISLDVRIFHTINVT